MHLHEFIYACMLHYYRQNEKNHGYTKTLLPKWWNIPDLQSQYRVHFGQNPCLMWEPSAQRKMRHPSGTLSIIHWFHFNQIIILHFPLAYFRFWYNVIYIFAWVAVQIASLLNGSMQIMVIRQSILCPLWHIRSLPIL